ncbi:MAG: hypothetical protein LBQ39_03200 [Tannerellaceae bacterium]|jgi:hypothetical protein|nr:hypothetical protein [Tannerellaceae bacterium]
MGKWVFVLACLLPFAGGAQQESKRLKHEFQLSAGLNSYFAFEIEPSYSYMFHKNIGVVGALRGFGELVDDLRYDLRGPEYQWRVIDNRKKVGGLIFRPAIRFRFPIVGDWVSIAAEPGVLLNLIPDERLEFGYVNTEKFEFITKYQTIKNKGGQVLFYEMKTYISAVIDNWSILAGYNLSTFDTYSGRRNIIIEGDALNTHLPGKTKFSHAGFVGVGYFF